MLSKLIKHEFRATSRIMWPVFLGMLALTALMRFSQLLLNGGHIPWLLRLIGVLLVIGFMMAPIKKGIYCGNYSGNDFGGLAEEDGGFDEDELGL